LVLGGGIRITRFISPIQLRRCTMLGKEAEIKFVLDSG
jgi:hypothetical protein